MNSTGTRSILGGVAAQLVALAPGSGSAAAATVAGGATHTLVVRTTDNTAWAWGANSDGQLGDNTTTQRKTPIQVSGLTGVVAVAAGAKHSLALTSAGVLWAWGDNASGQIGNGNNTDQKLPVQVMTGVSQIAAGDYHSIALKSDGSVRVWGANGEGQLGDGGTTNRNTPYQVTGLGLVNTIAGGGNHTLVVLAAGGALKAWGKNTNGQLGDGTTYARATSPVAVSTVLNAANAAGGSAFSFARLSNGSLYAWGLNANGQLGFGDTAQRPAPTALTAPTSVAAVATGGSHTVALSSSGSVSGWGHNAYGSVGDGSGTHQTSPVAISGLSSVVAIGAGQYHSVAVTSTGEVWAWGYNNQGQIGDGTSANRLAPIKVAEAGFAWKAATPTFSLAPGTYFANQSVTISCATSGATIRYTTNGTDPTPTSATYSSPVAITVSTTLKARAFKAGLADSTVAAGLYTLKVVTPAVSPAAGTYTTPQTVTISTTTSGATIRYTTDGTDPTAGSTAYGGPLAVGTTTTLKAAGFKAGWTASDVRTATYTMNFGTLPAPTFSPAAGNYVDSVSVTVSATAGATIRYTTNGSTPTTSSTLYTGPVSLGQTTTLKAKAWKVDYTESAVTSGTYMLKVATPLLSRVSGSYPAGTTVTVTSATAGASLYYTLDGSDPTESDPQVASGGSIVLGNYTLKVRSFKAGCDPSDVATATYSVSGQLSSGMVSAGQAFSMALMRDGTAYAWGYNASGQLGVGTTVDQPTPVRVSGLTGVVAIAAGSTHALALTSAGEVFAWGSNGAGQLGDGTTAGKTMPARVPGLTGVVAITAGEGVSAALRGDGSLWAWGDNGYGQIGTGDTVDRLVPVQVLTGVAQSAAGWHHMVARRTDGTLVAWGHGGYGQLGDGAKTNRWSPTSVPGLTAVSAVAGGGAHTLARLSGGDALAWGWNFYGQLGDASTVDRASPVTIGGLANATMLEGGYTHSLAVLADGSVRASGHNAYGQVGDGSTANRSTPTAVAGPAGIVAVAAGDYHSLALASDGTIFAWGRNQHGQLGDGTLANRLTPVRITEGPAWKVATPALAPPGGGYGDVQTVTVTVATAGATIRYTTSGAEPTPSDPAIPSGGTLTVDASTTVRAKAWKSGLADSNVATEVYALTVPTPTLSLAAGTYDTPRTVTVACPVVGATIRYTTDGWDPTPASAAIASGGTILVDATQTVKAKAWKNGWSDSGIIARAYTMAVGAPVLNPGGGSYSNGQIVTVTTTTPGATLNYTTNGRDPVPTDPSIVSGSSLTVDRTQTLKVVGRRSGWSSSPTTVASYYLLTGAAATPTFDPAPGSFVGPVSVELRTASPGALIRYTLDGSEPGILASVYVGPLVLDAAATLKARTFAPDRSPSSTAIGDYAIANEGAVATPILAPGPTRRDTSLTVAATTGTPAATVRYTTNGVEPASTDPDAGMGISVDRSLVLKARGWKAGLAPSGARAGFYVVTGALASGEEHILALAADRRVWSWGDNAQGQLGSGSTASRAVPAAIENLSGIVAVSAGSFHSLALDASGRVWAWGQNANGQLGDGTTTASLIPKLVPGLTDVVAIAAGPRHSLAVRVDGSVLAWGQNSSGQLGDGTTTQRTSPSAVPGLSQIVAVAAGGTHGLALTVDGRVWSWGSNHFGQLGDGTLASHLSPAVVPGLAGVGQVAAGEAFSVALKTDGLPWGSVWTWGEGRYGQLGYAGASNSRPAMALEEVLAVECGYGHTLALTRHGRVFAWGIGGRSQLGNGSAVNRFRPIEAASSTSAVALAAGVYHSAIVRADGGVNTWGRASTGIWSDTPVDVAGLRLVVNDVLIEDADSDRLSGWEEWRNGCDPYSADTNGDGVPDDVAVRLGLSCANLDTDGDGLLNAEEVTAGTSPTLSDSDGDGAADGQDCAPLDASRFSCSVDPNDHTPPVITLLEPPNALPLP